MPQLLHLSMNGTYMDQEHGRVLGEAIGGGALPKLEVLWVSENGSLGDGGVVPIMAGLEGEDVLISRSWRRGESAWAHREATPWPGLWHQATSAASDDCIWMRMEESGTRPWRRSRG